MKLRTPEDIKKLGVILGVWAHPDDETFSSGGILANAIANGQRVVCLTATSGEQGVQDELKWPRSKLAEIRKAEHDEAYKILGITEHHWLGYKDGLCKSNNLVAIETIRQFINKIQPDTILTFGADGLTGHTDHKAVHKWVTKANSRVENKSKIYQTVITTEQYEASLIRLDERLNFFFNIDHPKLKKEKDCDICLNLDKELFDIKYRALQAMPSQTQKMMDIFDRGILVSAFSTEAFIKYNS